MKNSLKKLLLTRIGGVPTAGGTLEQYAYELGYKGSTASRRLREMVKSGIIKPIYERGYVQYIRSEESGTTSTTPKGFRQETMGKLHQEKDNNRTVPLDFNLVSKPKTRFQFDPRGGG